MKSVYLLPILFFLCSLTTATCPLASALPFGDPAFCFQSFCDLRDPLHASLLMKPLLQSSSPFMVLLTNFVTSLFSVTVGLKPNALL